MGEREARKIAELLNGVGLMLTAELDPEKLVQADVGREMVGAEIGSFIHNVVNKKGESYRLYTLSGVRREAFAGFPMPSKYRSIPKVTEEHEALIRGVAAQVGIAMENARLFEQAQWGTKRAEAIKRGASPRQSGLETFAYSASHDLNEPLRTIAISAQLLDGLASSAWKARSRSSSPLFCKERPDGKPDSGSADVYDRDQYECGRPPGVDSRQALAAVLEI